MQQIQNGGTEKIELTIYKDGNLVNADGTVSVYIYNADEIVSASSTPTVLVSGTAVNEPPMGIYTYEINPSVTSIDRTLKVVWTYQVNSISASTTSFISVFTPYVTISDIVDYYDLGTKPSEINYKSQSQIVNLEKLARTVINGYAGQNFGRRYGYQEIFGQGSDAAWLTEPMLSIDQIYENDRLVYDSTGSVVYNTFGFNFEITQTNKVIRIVNPDWDVRYDNQVDPTILYYGRFRANSRYKFVGQIGWNYVPQDIKLCATLLVGDYMANDSAWRIKYLKKVGLSETNFEMHNGAFNGTGNLIVDNLLDSYRNVGIVII